MSEKTFFHNSRPDTELTRQIDANIPEKTRLRDCDLTADRGEAETGEKNGPNGGVTGTGFAIERSSSQR